MSKSTIEFLIHSFAAESSPRLSLTFKRSYGEERSFRGDEVLDFEDQDIDTSRQIFFYLQAEGVSVHGTFYRMTESVMFSMATIEADSEQKAAMFEGIFAAIQQRFRTDAMQGGFVAKPHQSASSVQEKKKESDPHLAEGKARVDLQASELKTSESAEHVERDSPPVKPSPKVRERAPTPQAPRLASPVATPRSSSSVWAGKILGGLLTTIGLGLTYFFGCRQTQLGHFTETIEGGAQFKLVKLQPKTTKDETDYDLLTHSAPFDIQIVNVGRVTATGLIFKCGSADEHGPQANLGTLAVQEKVEIHSHLYDGDADPLHANDRTCFNSSQRFLQFDDALGKAREVRFDMYGNAVPTHD